MTATNHTIPALADRLSTLADAYKEDVDAVIEDAKKADVDTGALRRLVSWQRKDATQRADQEAIDHQYRFLAGELDEPATLPAGGQLAEVARYYRDKLTVRQVSDLLKISVGKAHKLKTLTSMFTDVHSEMNVNTMNSAPPVEMTLDDLGTVEPCVDTPREMTADDLGDPLWVVDKDRARFRDKVRGIASSVKVTPLKDSATPSAAEPQIDTLEYLPFLRRSRVSA